MTTTLAGSSDLVADGDSYTADQIAGALTWATSVISGYCHRNFDLVTDETVVLTPQRKQALLPEYPVINVSAVLGYMPSHDTGLMAWVTLTNYFWSPNDGLLYDTTGLPGTVWMHGHSWPWLPGSLKVTYDHGYATVPQDLKDVCVRLAQQYLSNPDLMIERRVGDMEGRFSGSAGATFTDMDKAVLGRYCNVGVS